MGTPRRSSRVLSRSAKDARLPPVNAATATKTPSPRVQYVPPSPQWLLQNCVRSVEELKTRKLGLTLVDSPISTTNSTDREQSARGNYEVPRIMYQSLQKAYSLAPSQDAACPCGRNGVHFHNIFIRLCSPTQALYSHRFFESFVEYFGREIGAEVVRLSPEDLQHLAAHVIDSQPNLTHFECWKALLPVQSLLRSPGITSISASDPTVPLIIHLTDFTWYSKSQLGSLIFKSIQQEIATLQGDRVRALIIGSDGPQPCSCTKCDSQAVDPVGTQKTPRNVKWSWDPESKKLEGHEDDDSPNLHCPKCRQPFYHLQLGNGGAHNIMIAPVPSQEQRRLLQRDVEDRRAAMNISALQKQLRLNHTKVNVPETLLPYASWPFIGPRAREALRESIFDTSQIVMIERAVAGKEIAETIEEAIVGTDDLSGVMSMWTSDDVLDEKWSNFPAHVQKAIRKIKNEPGNDLENELLKVVVDPGTLTETWKDIELEPESQLNVQMLAPLSIDPDLSTRIPERVKIGGILLYGPPGTGKTQLARVLAQETSATILSVSPADIMSKWLGETEQRIKALFTLARMLTPSIIFIDEADSLFRARSNNSQSWDISRVDQLLIETDGANKGHNQPFLILATNHPENLDPAVLRRVPCRVHLGLPTEHTRERILKIHLREKDTDATVDPKVLASETQGCSGSDLSNICSTAAMLCEWEASASGEHGARRLLKKHHFERAIYANPPTVSKQSLDQIQAFHDAFHKPIIGVKVRSAPGSPSSNTSTTTKQGESAKRKAPSASTNVENDNAKRPKPSSATPNELLGPEKILQEALSMVTSTGITPTMEKMMQDALRGTIQES